MLRQARGTGVLERQGRGRGFGGGTVVGLALALGAGDGAALSSTEAVKQGVGGDCDAGGRAVVLCAGVADALGAAAELTPAFSACPQLVSVRPPNAAAMRRRRRSRIAPVSSESPTDRGYRTHSGETSKISGSSSAAASRPASPSRSRGTSRKRALKFAVMR